MKRTQIVFFVTLFLLLGFPAYGYGDPTGGTLFQILLPMLAAFWAMVLILANGIRRKVAGLAHKFRGSHFNKPAA